MAVLDRYLEAMTKQQAEAVVFRTGAPVELQSQGAGKPISTRPASTEQIQSVLTEVIGEPAMVKLRQAVPADFSYASPFGSARVTVVLEATGLTARVQLGGAPAAAPSAQASASSPPPPPAAAPAPELVRPTPPAAAAAEPQGSSLQIKRVSEVEAETLQSMPAHLEELFVQMVEMKASDLHLKSGKVPILRIDGDIQPITTRPPIDKATLEKLIHGILPDENRAEFERTNDTDFAYAVANRGRFRCNVFRDLAGIGLVARQIPSKILTAEQLRLPPAVMKLCELDKGLVLVTGPTGSGKSTTLAAMIDWINANRSDHLITIEDPVEFVHPDKKCLVNQREVGKTTASFKSALRAALREDPDIVLVGELRDLETVAIAIETAETGHLVFGTLHTNTAASTIDRIIDQFPADRQQQVRTMLAESLKGVVSQTLLKKKGGGRAAALEILLVTSALSNMIREAKTHQIPSVMQTSKNLGMQTISDAMLDLVRAGVVEPAEAWERHPNKKEFAEQLTKAGFKGAWSSSPAAS